MEVNQDLLSARSPHMPDQDHGYPLPGGTNPLIASSRFPLFQSVACVCTRYSPLTAMSPVPKDRNRGAQNCAQVLVATSLVQPYASGGPHALCGLVVTLQECSTARMTATKLATKLGDEPTQFGFASEEQQYAWLFIFLRKLRRENHYEIP